MVHVTRWYLSVKGKEKKEDWLVFFKIFIIYEPNRCYTYCESIEAGLQSASEFTPLFLLHAWHCYLHLHYSREFAPIDTPRPPFHPLPPMFLTVMQTKVGKSS